MKLFVLILVCSVALAATGASYVWQCYYEGELPLETYSDPMFYGFPFGGIILNEADVEAANPKAVASVGGSFYGWQTEDSLMLKQYDYTRTPMPIDNDLFLVAFYGEILGQDTIASFTPLTLSAYTPTSVDGTLVGSASDFYLGFVVTEKEDYFYIKENTRKWYGWARFSFEEGRYTLLDSDVALDGGSITVGEHWSSEPEPAAGTLAALGLAALLLRRRFGR